LCLSRTSCFFFLFEHQPEFKKLYSAFEGTHYHQVTSKFLLTGISGCIGGAIVASYFLGIFSQRVGGPKPITLTKQWQARTKIMDVEDKAYAIRSHVKGDSIQLPIEKIDQ